MMQILSFDHPDPDRADKEAMLYRLSETGFRDLYHRTRAEASAMRRAGDMERLYGLTRGLKTLQRIGGERGIVLKVQRAE
ncbi:hypothetical protein [Thalassospira sp.]|uniref:hypothetical protein n=1 Tax=Thalassospira sp. TaxID=1912094 RepID=UPI002734A6CE|nr:hypothetical protein [Thalassospira sp.]MDP2698722.1 hypothetical protein [Thalassospira sp.]